MRPKEKETNRKYSEKKTVILNRETDSNGTGLKHSHYNLNLIKIILIYYFPG